MEGLESYRPGRFLCEAMRMKSPAFSFLVRALLTLAAVLAWCGAARAEQVPVGAFDSSPAIHRRVYRGRAGRPIGTLERILCWCSFIRPYETDNSFYEYPAINRRATFGCPSGTNHF
jgi:hypothetical protein